MSRSKAVARSERVGLVAAKRIQRGTTFLDEKASNRISLRSTSPPNLAKGLFFGFASVVIFIIAGCIANYQYNFLSHAQKAAGVVKFLNAGGSHPEIEFTTKSGEVVSYPQGGMMSGYEPGQAVEVFYNAENPSLTPVIDDPGAIWGMATLIGVIGLAFLWGGAGEILSSRGKSTASA